MDAALHALLNKLVDATLDRDHSQIDQIYDFPITLVRPTGAQIFETAQEFVDELDRVSRAQGVGIAAIHKEVLDSRHYPGGVRMVDVRFTFLDRNGKEVRSFVSTYVLRSELDSLRISMHVSHNEILERPVV